MTPTPRIQRYVDELLSRWPDINTDEGQDSRWADGPMGRPSGTRRGPMIYFAMVTSRAADVVDEIAELATAGGLVCFDPPNCHLALTDRAGERQAGRTAARVSAPAT